MSASMPNGTVYIVSHRSEMGQGIRTSLTSIVADELEADWSRVKVVQAPGDPVYGDQNTDGSWSVRGFMERMRIAGATARQMLEQAAADRWQVDVSECRAHLHQVLHDDGNRALDYRDLVADAAGLPVPEPDRLTFKPDHEFHYIGKDMPMVDMDDFIQGRAIYGTDVSIPGMKYAAIARCPVALGRVKSFDAQEALALKGVNRVIEIKAAEPPAAFQALGGIAVIADNTWAALEGRRRLKIEWDVGENGDYDSDDYRMQLLRTVRQQGDLRRNEGGCPEGPGHGRLDAGSRVLHPAPRPCAPMEPPAALASVTADACEIWAPTQAPQSVIPAAAGLTGLKPEQIKVNVTLLGGAFGRKSKCDFINEAVILSQETGAPVKVVWSREDDIRHGYYHAPSAQYLKAGISATGAVTGWLQRTAFPPIKSTFDVDAIYPADWELGQGSVSMPFAIDNIRVEAGAAPAKIRIGWLRSVCNIFQAFAVCSFADEIAWARGRDPLENYLDLLGPDRLLDFSGYGMEGADGYTFDTARLRHVAELAAEKAGWGRKPAPGHGLGFAAHYSFLSYTAAVIEVSVGADGSWRVPRAHVAFDCGLAVNPDRVRSQLEGAVVFGIGLARDGLISVADGRVVQGNFDDYPMLRMDMTPATSIHLVQSDGPPAGVGEPGVPPIAPALANAIYAATGKRLREMPFGARITSHQP